MGASSNEETCAAVGGFTIGSGRHLVCVSHGMWGRVDNVMELAKGIAADADADATVFVAASNQFLRTYDGIAVCGQRLADSIRALVAASPVPFERLSLVGYSAGGLFVRYAAGVLHGDGFFAAAGLEPTLLVTIATPHLGSRWHGDTPVARALVSLQEALSNLYGGRALTQMMLADNDGESGVPILQAISAPGSRYYAALASFERIYFYANARADRTVPYHTAAAARANPYAGMVAPPPAIDGHEYVMFSGPVGNVPSFASGGNVSSAAPATVPTAAAASTTAAGRADAAMVRPAPVQPTTVISATATQVAAVMLLAPIALLHMALVMLPMRVTSFATRDETATAAARGRCSRDGRSSRSASRNGSLSGSGSGNRSCGSLSGSRSGSSLLRSDAPTDATGGPDVASATVAAAAAAGESSAAVAACLTEQTPEEVAERILEDLHMLTNLHRVDVALPGFHTHGAIVVRRRNRHSAGYDVIKHVQRMIRRQDRPGDEQDEEEGDFSGESSEERSDGEAEAAAPAAAAAAAVDFQCPSFAGTAGTAASVLGDISTTVVSA